MKLSVVIPAYNEEENIRNTVMDVVKHFPGAEIIVINDGSTDKTYSILCSMLHKIKRLDVLSNYPNKGHGYSVVRGLLEAKGDYILYIDADRQIGLQHYGIDTFLQSYDFVSGWRIDRHDKPFRKVISFCLKMTNLFRHGYYIRDANCPFKVYKRDKLRILLKELPKTYIVPIACLEILARKHNMNVATTPTPHKPYQGVRKGFLQSFNPQMYKFLWSAFKEIISL